MNERRSRRILDVVERHQAAWAAEAGRVAIMTADTALKRSRDGLEPGQIVAVVNAVVRGQAHLAGRAGSQLVTDALGAAGKPARHTQDLRLPDGPPVNIPEVVRRAWVRARKAAPDGQDLHTDLLRADIVRIVGDALTDLWRQGAEAAVATHPEIIGWRRVARTGCCGACFALDNGHLMAAGMMLPTHNRCRCTLEPVIEGVNERWAGTPPQQRWDRMTVAEQNHMFYGHGGEQKADLIRTGQVQLEDLVTVEPRHAGQRPFVRETTYQELTADSRAGDAAESASRLRGDEARHGRPVRSAPTGTPIAVVDSPIGPVAYYRSLFAHMKKKKRWLDRHEFRASMASPSHTLPDLEDPENRTIIVIRRGPERTTRWMIVVTETDGDHTWVVTVVYANRLQDKYRKPQ